MSRPARNQPSDHIYEQIGKRVNTVRKRLGLSQEALATQVSLTRTSITNIERGRQGMMVHTLVQLASALRVPIAELLPEPVNTGSNADMLQLIPDEDSKAFVLRVLANPKGDDK